MARYTALLRDHVRPSIGTRPLKQLTPLEIQAIYDHLAVSGRRDHKPGGLATQHILAVHRCLHRALAQAVTWRLLAHNPATHATPPPVPRTEVAALAPEEFERLAAGMAVARARYHGMRRNALYAIGRSGDGAARGVVERLVDDGDASVRDAAVWALQRLGQDRS